MGRSRSRSRSRSSSYSSSEDEEERKEREAREQEEREQREYEREQRKAAKKKVRLEQAATEKTGTLPWTLAIPAGNGDVEDEDPFVITMRAKKPPTAPAGVVDVQEWAPLKTYLRTQFEVPDSVKKLKLKVVVRLDGEIKLR